MDKMSSGEIFNIFCDFQLKRDQPTNQQTEPLKEGLWRT